MTEKIGFIGVGNMGTPMAFRVLRAGYPMVVYDVRPAQVEPFRKEGAETASSPKDVASRCRTILLSLPTSPIVEQVALGEDGIAAAAEPGTAVVDLTSGNPPHTAIIAARLMEKWIRMIDAGVSGGVTGAEKGTLGIMVGGDGEVFEQVRPILKHIGANLFHMGDIGAGHATKALNNFLSAINYAAVSEALVVAVKAGLDPVKATAAFNASSGRSWASQDRVPNYLLKGDFSYGGGMAMDLLVKDLATACSIGKENNVPMPLANVVHQLLMQAAAEVGDKAPNTSVTRLFEKWAGVEVRGS